MPLSWEGVHKTLDASALKFAATPWAIDILRFVPDNPAIGEGGSSGSPLASAAEAVCFRASPAVNNAPTCSPLWRSPRAPGQYSERRANPGVFGPALKGGARTILHGL